MAVGWSPSLHHSEIGSSQHCSSKYGSFCISSNGLQLARWIREKEESFLRWALSSGCISRVQSEIVWDRKWENSCKFRMQEWVSDKLVQRKSTITEEVRESQNLAGKIIQ